MTSFMAGRRRLSVSQITTRDWDFAADTRAYHAAGIDAIGVWRSKLEPFGVTEGAALLRSLGLPAANLVGILNLIGEADTLGDNAFDDPRRAIDEAVAIGAGVVVVVPGRLHGRTPERATALTVEALGRLAPDAAAAGVRLAVEPIHPHHMDFVNSLHQATALVRAVDHPAIGLLFDAWHLWQEPELEAHIAAAGDRIFAVHVSDWREPTRSHNDRLVMGDGVIPLARIIRAIEATGYAGYYDVEIFSEELWRGDHVAMLARCRAWFDDLAG
jgi:sugar phosphate isomerase/epimerase